MYVAFIAFAVNNAFSLQGNIFDLIDFLIRFFKQFFRCSCSYQINRSSQIYYHHHYYFEDFIMDL